MTALRRCRRRALGRSRPCRAPRRPRELPVPDASCDRVVSTYVLDLLGPADGAAFVAEARRVLRARGLLALASLAPGRTPPARLVTAPLAGAVDLNPALLGGCRPLRLGALLDADESIVLGELPRHGLVPELGRAGRAPALSAVGLPAVDKGESRMDAQRVPPPRSRAGRVGRRLSRADRRLPGDEPGAAGRGGRRCCPPSRRCAREGLDDIVADLDRIVLPGITHWNHPGFLPTSPPTPTWPRCSPTWSPPASAPRA